VIQIHKNIHISSSLFRMATSQQPTTGAGGNTGFGGGNTGGFGGFGGGNTGGFGGQSGAGMQFDTPTHIALQRKYGMQVQYPQPQAQGGIPSLFGGYWRPIRQEERPAHLTVDEVGRIQKMAIRTANPRMIELARKAQQLSLQGQAEGDGLYRDYITPDKAAELLDIGIKTQDREIADWTRYAESCADTTGLCLVPERGWWDQLIQRGNQEVQQRGAQNPPGLAFGNVGVGPAFASVGFGTAGFGMIDNPMNAYRELHPNAGTTQTQQQSQQQKIQQPTTQQQQQQQATAQQTQM
jgi:hypothetical protein